MPGKEDDVEEESTEEKQKESCLLTKERRQFGMGSCEVRGLTEGAMLRCEKGDEKEGTTVQLSHEFTNSHSPRNCQTFVYNFKSYYPLHDGLKCLFSLLSTVNCQLPK